MLKNVPTYGMSLRIVLALTLLVLSALPLMVAAQDMMDDSVFFSIRRYDGIDLATMEDIESITREGFVPILSGSDGFIGYYVVYTAEDVLVAINLFESREQSLASNEQAREFVEESLAPLLPNPPQIVEGSVDIGFVELLEGMNEGEVGSLFASVRIYDGFDSQDRDAFVTLVEDGFLPIMRDSDGFFGYYLMNDGADRVAAISIFDSEASAMTSNEAAADFVAENLTQYLPNAPSITAGRVGIAALADVNEVVNLIDDRTFVSIRVYDGVDPADHDEIVRIGDEGLPADHARERWLRRLLLAAGRGQAGGDQHVRFGGASIGVQRGGTRLCR